MFKVKAIYEYASGHEDDLAFPVGQIITVTEEEDADWYSGEYLDDAGVKHEGIFPMNFVEKYEPTAPPRPTRTRTKKEADPAAAPEGAAAATSPLSPKLPEPEREAELEATSPTQTSSALPPVPLPVPEAAVTRPEEPVALETAPPPAPMPVQAASTSSAPAPKPAPTQHKPMAPPPVSEKPKPSSFKDRIAAFNKPAAPPITPFKPSGLGPGSSGFIKKPFVAPPPSRNAYVPPARDVPVAKVYRRDEDPEIKEREAENMETAEKAGLVPGTSAEGEDAEDQPKPMSLKERLALLQKQQMEAAQRHADASSKKEKPKRPPKKRMESQDVKDEAEAAAPPPERRDTEQSARKQSVDEQRPPRPPHTHRRKSSKGPEPHDGNEADMSGAGDTTEGQEEDVTEREDSYERPRHVATAAKQDDEDIDEEEDDDEEGDDDVDPEVQRKEELRARMARIAGGMTGMAGIFGGPMPGSGAPAPPRKKKSVAEASEEAGSPGGHAPPVPMMMALPGMSRPKSPEGKPQEEPSQGPESEEESEMATPQQENSPPSLPSRELTGPPPIPGGRPAPPPIPTESRPQPPTPSAVISPSEGSESDDELSEVKPDVTQAARAPPPPPVAVPASMASPKSPTQKRLSYAGDEAPPMSPTSAAPAPPGKRNSRLPPPVPGSAPGAPPGQTRPPPPPPPGAGPRRQSTADSQHFSPTKSAVYEDDGDEEEITEYEGDYDTDIASSVPHKDALKSHQRESSFEEGTPVRSSISEAPPSLPPPVPSATAPRAGPPPIPSLPPPDKRKSTEMPRAAPPPPPPAKETPNYNDDDYDPFNYTASPGAIVAIPTPSQPPPPPRHSEEAYSPRPSYQASQDRRAPPSGPPLSNRSHRASLDVQRAGAPGRRSVDVTRPSMESGFVANEIDLAPQSGWWLQPSSLPPQLQGRKDIFFESEESTAATPRAGAKMTVTRDIYVLFQDYSQTVITVRFDPQDASDVRLEQRHEPPPRALRQDQLEQSYERFGRAIGEAAPGKKDTVVGDGTPQALVYELLRPHAGALLPVGTRAYGALVYSNLANASTSQNDEIRPGDIISIRNAKFQGKHGAMHAKYSMEVGKPDHVAVVAEWDGTKRKVRAWEQGRESKKVKVESFRLDDLRSGEVKIWRVMPRSWVGWEGGN